MGGVLDIHSTRKIARFVQICDAYNIPLLFIVDCPGYLPGGDQESNGVIGKGAYMTHVISRATVPRVTMIVRKAIGGAYATLNSKHLGSDFTIAWASAEISVVGMDAALDLLLKSRMDLDADDPNVMQSARADYREKFLNPYRAAARGLVDRVIEPADSRVELIRAFNRLENKIRKAAINKKFGILPMA
jgi:propionyl-CoA carboxylase beta chain